MSVRVLPGLLVLGLAAGAAVWLALREGASRERDAAGRVAGDAAPPMAIAEPLSMPVETRAQEPAGALASRVATTTAKAEVFVRDARGEPVPGALCALFRGERVFSHGATDEQGRLALPRVPLELELLVVPPAHPSQVFRLAEVERQELALVTGLAVAGVVRVDGRAPAEPIELILRHDSWFDVEPRNRAVWDALGEGVKERAKERLRARTDADGAFRFDGLPADFTGELSWTGPFLDQEEAEDEADSRSVAAGSEDLLLLLEPVLVVTGRVVDPLTGTAVTEAEVTAACTYEDGDSDWESAEAGQDGTFEIRLGRKVVAYLDLEVGDADGRSPRIHELHPVARQRRLEAGDLAILPGRTLAVVVRDAGGAPVPKAGVDSVPAAGARPMTTDEAGHCRLRVDLDTRAVRVVAAGFRTEEFALQALADPIVLTLRQGTALEIRADTDLALAGVTVRAAEPPFLRSGEPSWSPEASSGAHEHRYRGKGWNYYGAPSGIYLLSGVRPGIPLMAELIDRCGNGIVAQDVPPLASGERRIVELRGTRATRILVGRVLSAEGAPVRSTSVRIGPVHGDLCCDTETDDRGVFRFEGLAADTVRLAVEGTHGSPPSLRDAVPVVESPPIELVLDSGRDVEVRLAGPDGEPVAEARVSARLDGTNWSQSVDWMERPGVFVLRDAPACALPLVALVGGRSFQGRVDSGAADAQVQMQVPAWQGCAVSLIRTIPPRAGEETFIRLRSDHGVVWRSTPALEAAAGVHFPVVFPGRYELTATSSFADRELYACEPMTVEITPGAPASVSVELRPR